MAKTPSKIAEENMKGWVAVEQSPLDSAPAPKVDSVGVDLERLKEKYFGEAKPRGADGGAGRTERPVDSDDAALVIMERKGTHDFSPGQKTMVVRGRKVIGTQG